MWLLRLIVYLLLVAVHIELSNWVGGRGRRRGEGEEKRRGGGEEERGWGLRPSDVVGGVSGCHSSGWSGSQEQSSEKPSLRLHRIWGWDRRGQD